MFVYANTVGLTSFVLYCDFLISEIARAREWDGVVTCHAGLHYAKSWNLNNACMGKHSLTSAHREQKPKPQVISRT